MLPTIDEFCVGRILYDPKTRNDRTIISNVHWLLVHSKASGPWHEFVEKVITKSCRRAVAGPTLKFVAAYPEQDGMTSFGDDANVPDLEKQFDDIDPEDYRKINEERCHVITPIEGIRYLRFDGDSKDHRTSEFKARYVIQLLRAGVSIQAHKSDAFKPALLWVDDELVGLLMECFSP